VLQLYRVGLRRMWIHAVACGWEAIGLGMTSWASVDQIRADLAECWGGFEVGVRGRSVSGMGA
jgi:hypothetical protein